MGLMGKKSIFLVKLINYSINTALCCYQILTHSRKSQPANPLLAQGFKAPSSFLSSNGNFGVPLHFTQPRPPPSSVSSLEPVEKHRRLTPPSKQSGEPLEVSCTSRLKIELGQSSWATYAQTNPIGVTDVPQVYSQTSPFTSSVVTSLVARMGTFFFELN